MGQTLSLTPKQDLSAIGAEYWMVSKWVRDGCWGWDIVDGAWCHQPWRTLVLSKGRLGKRSPESYASWEAVTSTGTAGGESGGRKSISSHKQPPASWLVTDSS